ncbi:MAG: hypothetical protein MJZ76_06015 [Bacteroidales bacterium]|nr:hypothetical protein [Bacteroidales bacterium]
MKKIVVILLLILPLLVVAQGKKSVKLKDDDEKEYEEHGTDLYIGAGLYMGGKKTAAYYSGMPENAITTSGGNSLNYIFGNTYIKDEIDNLIRDHHHSIPSGSKIFVSSYPEKDMRYAPALMVQLGAKYRFNPNWALSIAYSFAQLKAKGSFFVTYSPRESGNENPQYLPYGLQGKEHRSFIDLICTYTFDSEGRVRPFFDFGAQFNFVRVKKFQAQIEGRDFSLIDIYGGSSYVPGLDMQTYDVRLGGAGFGFSAALGLKLIFNNLVSLDPLVYCSYSRLGLEVAGSKSFSFSYGVAVRIIMAP